MGFSESPLLLKVNLILLIIALVIQILSIALPHWVVVDSLDVNFGLFQSCSGGTCRTISNEPDWLEACQAFGIIATLVIVAALVVTIIVIFVKDMNVLKIVACVLAFVAAFCIMIEFAVFVGEQDTYEDYLSGAFAIAVINFVLCLVIGVIGVVVCLGKGK